MLALKINATEEIVLATSDGPVIIQLARRSYAKLAFHLPPTVKASRRPRTNAPKPPEPRSLIPEISKHR